MARAVINYTQPTTGRVKGAPVGFSWTTLFFGPFPAFLRGDVIMALVMAITNFLTFGLAIIPWAFFYNGIYERGLIGRGFTTS